MTDAQVASRLQADEARVAGGASAETVRQMLHQFAAEAATRSTGIVPTMAVDARRSEARELPEWMMAATKTSPLLVVLLTIAAIPQWVGITIVVTTASCTYDPDAKTGQQRNPIDQSCDEPLVFWLVIYMLRLAVHVAVLWTLMLGKCTVNRGRRAAASAAALAALPTAAAPTAALPTRQSRRYARVIEEEAEEEASSNAAGGAAAGAGGLDASATSTAAAAVEPRPVSASVTRVLVGAAGVKNTVEMVGVGWFFLGLLFVFGSKNCETLCPSLFAATQYVVLFNSLIVVAPCLLVVLGGIIFSLLCVPYLSRRQSTFATQWLARTMQTFGAVNGFEFDVHAGGAGRSAVAGSAARLAKGATALEIEAATELSAWVVSAADAEAPAETQPHCAVCQAS